jgi:D-alanyl-D-alanine dipeptidase
MHEFDSRPIPFLDAVRERARHAHAHPIDLDSIENTERPQNLCDDGIAGANYYHRKDNPPYWQQIPGAIPELFVREGLLWRLRKANKRLHASGLELYIFDAYRPIAVQNYLYNEWAPQFLQKHHSEWTKEMIDNELRRSWDKGIPSGKEINLSSPPRHSTGGAIDCTIRDRHTGELLYMGTQLDEVDVIAHTDYLEVTKQNRPLTVSEKTALFNRRILYWLMNDVGMVNYPNEWWHYSYGDQMWAKLSGAEQAVYSCMLFDKQIE